VAYAGLTFHRYDVHPSRVVHATLGNRLVPPMCGVRMISGGNANAADDAGRGDAKEGWLAAPRLLSASPGARRSLGVTRRASVEADHSLQVIASRLVAMLQAPSGIGA